MTIQPTASVHRIAALGQDNFEHNPFLRNMTEDEINTLSYDGSNNFNPSEHSPSNIFDYKYQAEQTFMIYGSQGQGGMQDNPRLPPGFKQQFEEKNSRKYPKHPNPPHLVSDFPLGHRGCYLFGGPFVFWDCPRQQEHRAL